MSPAPGVLSAQGRDLRARSLSLQRQFLSGQHQLPHSPPPGRQLGKGEKPILAARWQDLNTTMAAKPWQLRGFKSSFISWSVSTGMGGQQRHRRPMEPQCVRSASMSVVGLLPLPRGVPVLLAGTTLNHLTFIVFICFISEELGLPHVGSEASSWWRGLREAIRLCRCVPLFLSVDLDKGMNNPQGFLF